MSPRLRWRTSLTVLAAAMAITAMATLRAEPAGRSVTTRLQAAGTAPAQCAITWAGHDAEIEEFMRTAQIVKTEDVPIGVTKPRRAYFPAGGPVARAAWKALPPRVRNGFYESYKAEVAAYVLDRMLEMHMVPPAVERRVDGDLGALILWIENIKSWDAKNPPRGPEPGWSRQIVRMKMFDQLIANIDRNQGNLIYDGDWHLFLIDHSRAFTDRKSIDGIAAPTQVDKALWDRMDALTFEQLEAGLGKWLGKRELDAILARRDRMRTAVQKLVKEKGQSVFIH